MASLSLRLRLQVMMHLPSSHADKGKFVPLILAGWQEAHVDFPTSLQLVSEPIVVFFTAT